MVYGLGVVTGYPRITDIELAEEGRDKLGIRRIASTGGLLIGLEGSVEWVLGRSGWSLGLDALLMTGDKAELAIETRPGSDFRSGKGIYAPGTYSVTVGYRFR